MEAQDQSPIALFIGDNVTALTNTSITIQCPTSGVPTPTVTWTKDGEEVTNDGRYTVKENGSLLISETREEDSARYTCSANSVTGRDNASSTVQIIGKKYNNHVNTMSVKLVYNVLYLLFTSIVLACCVFNLCHNLTDHFFMRKEPTKPVINVPEYGKEIFIGDGSPVTMNVGDNVTAASNTTITIKCPVSGVPTPSATWQKDGMEIGEGDKLTILDDNTLVIKDADLEDDAKYTCTIQNSFGKDEVSSIVRIIGKWSFVVQL